MNFYPLLSKEWFLEKEPFFKGWFFSSESAFQRKSDQFLKNTFQKNNLSKKSRFCKKTFYRKKIVLGEISNSSRKSSNIEPANFLSTSIRYLEHNNNRKRWRHRYKVKKFEEWRKKISLKFWRGREPNNFSSDCYHC